MEHQEYNPEKILEKIIVIERDFPVNEWKINGVHFWPFLRTALAFTQRQNFNATATGKKSSVKKKLIKRYSKLIFFLPFHFLRLKKRIRKAKRLFLGAKTHRVNANGKLYNKYFDLAINDFKSNDQQSVILDRGTSLRKKEYPHNEAWFSLPAIYVIYESLKRLKLIKRNHYNIELSGYEDFYQYVLENFDYTQKLLKGFSPATVRKGMTNFHDRKEFLKRLFQKSDIESCYVLCYYSSLYYPLLAACNELGINTIDLQHGGMGRGHFSYDRWTSVPEDGYKLLPRYFWTWDDSSSALINNWAGSSGFHRAITMGNPWLEDSLCLMEGEARDKDYVLYNMADLEVDDYLVKTILHYGTSKKWIFRLHPRQITKKNKVERQLRELQIDQYVVVEDSTEVPLSISLRNCSALISPSSGTIIEAVQLGIKPVLLPAPGLSYYDDYVKEEKVFLLHEKSSRELIRLIDSVPSREVRSVKGTSMTYRNRFPEFENLLKRSN
ncbi:hypothetical protein [Fulvivirga imtechensis]|nr:hypothetical protein [Fulvivirga imtechensis]